MVETMVTRRSAPWNFHGALLVAPQVVLAVVTALVVWPAFAHALEVWSTTEEFSYGFLIPPISVLVVWWHRAALRRSIAADKGTPAGLAVVIGALAVYLIAERIGIHALAGLAVTPLLWGTAVFLWGMAAGRILAFPLAFLVFGLGVFRGLLDTVGFALQGITAVGASSIAQLAGLSVVRDGVTLTSDRFAFVVAEPCSGMSSLVSLLALAALWVYAARGTMTARTVVLLSVAPLAVAANSLRVAVVLVIAQWFGQDTAIGFFHGASSLVLFGIALSGLLAVSRLVGCMTPAVRPVGANGGA